MTHIHSLPSECQLQYSLAKLVRNTLVTVLTHSLQYTVLFMNVLPYFPVDNARIIYTKMFSKREKTTVRVMQLK
jgi:hypothetical protein